MTEIPARGASKILSRTQVWLLLIISLLPCSNHVYLNSNYMPSQELHNFLFKLYDFADYIADEIESGRTQDVGGYFLTLVYIEQIFDRYGRGLIRNSSIAAGSTQDEASVALGLAHKRIDSLRNRLETLVENGNFDKTLEDAAKALTSVWVKRIN